MPKTPGAALRHLTAPSIAQRRESFGARFGIAGLLGSLVFHNVLLAIALFLALSAGRAPEGESVFVSGRAPRAPRAAESSEPARQTAYRSALRPADFSKEIFGPKRLVVKVPAAVNLPVLARPAALSDVDLPAEILAGRLRREAAEALFRSDKNVGGAPDVIHGENADSLEGAAAGVPGQGGGGVAGGGLPGGSPFGSRAKRVDFLEGTLYDFARDKSGALRAAIVAEDTETPAAIQTRMAALHGFLARFVSAGMRRESLREDYFEHAQKLYASHIFITPTRSRLAAEAFGCAGEVGASTWAAIYEGWISPPETDYFRFAGRGDDVLLAGIDGVPVFFSTVNGGWNLPGGLVKPGGDWAPRFAGDGSPPIIQKGERHFGSWVRLEKGRHYRVQIAFAEAYGKTSFFELQIQQRRQDGDDLPAKERALPVFSVAPLDAGDVRSANRADVRWRVGGPVFGVRQNVFAVRAQAAAGGADARVALDASQAPPAN